jgi:NADH-quinone oxidoreductase subunit L
MSVLNENLLLTLVLAPLLGSIIAGLFGKIIGEKASHTVTIIGVMVAFVLSVWVFKLVIFDSASYNARVYQWLQAGSLSIEIGFMVDSLTAIMLVVVTFVSLMVHIYTVGYMKGDDGYSRFFSYI